MQLQVTKLAYERSRYNGSGNKNKSWQSISFVKQKFPLKDNGLLDR